MRRRAFVRATGLSLAALGVGGWVTGCGGVERVFAEQPGLRWLPATFHPLVGEDQPVVFGLRDAAGEPVEDAGPEVYTLDVADEVLAGPFEVEWHPGAGGAGLYLTRVAFTEPGATQVAAVVGDDHGKQTLSVTTPSDSPVPAPGQDAVAAPTPTVDDPGGVARLCTRSPEPCGAHTVSLDTALADGRPALLLFATPAHCGTAVCGPAVDVLDELRASRDWGDLAFVHSEIFARPPGGADDGDGGGGDGVLAAAVGAWRLPSEPWLFAIDRDGTVLDRLDGAIIGDVAESMARRLA